MGGVGGPEILVILLVALLVFGPKSIPEVARTIGKGVRELRRLATEFQREVNIADAEDDDRRQIRPPPAVTRDVAEIAPAAAQIPPATEAERPPDPAALAEPADPRGGVEAGGPVSGSPGSGGPT